MIYRAGGNGIAFDQKMTWGQGNTPLATSGKRKLRGGIHQIGPKTENPRGRGKSWGEAEAFAMGRTSCPFHVNSIQVTRTRPEALVRGKEG